jgi:glycerol-3-phosphate dehydrogenase (NAD(P)+)
MTAIAIYSGTPLGAALAARLRADGRTVEAGTDPAPLARAARLIVLDAAPSSLRAAARALGDHLDGNHLVAHMVRGLQAGGVGASEVVHEETAVRRIGVLAGPFGAADLRDGRPAAAVIASRHPEVVDEFAAALSTPKLRVYRGRDPVGAEIASSLADLVSLGCGLVDGLGFGEVTRSVMIVRALRELGRIIGARGGEPATATGLAGLGDVLGRLRDADGEPYRYGRALAAGGAEPPPPSVAELMETARALRQLTVGRRVQANILDGFAQLAAGEVAPAELLARLMALPVLDD